MIGRTTLAATLLTIAACSGVTDDPASRDEATGFPNRIRRTKDGMEMVLVPGGTFWMGAVPGDALAEQVPDERPRHPVTLSKAYYVDVHEVTNEQFERFVAEGIEFAYPTQTLFVERGAGGDSLPAGGDARS